MQVNPEFVRDHMAFFAVPFKDPSPLVTLGGLRGYMDECVGQHQGCTL